VDTADPGTVIGMNRDPGSKVQRGSTVTLTVAKAPEDTPTTDSADHSTDESDTVDKHHRHLGRQTKWPGPCAGPLRCDGF
jgi:beta-lactam-binding protein with PASTA domain